MFMFSYYNGSEQLNYQLEEQIIDFVKKTNDLALKSLFTKNKVDTLMITRAFDLLFNFKHLKKYFKDKQKYLQLKVLTYNNLSCIYKQ